MWALEWILNSLTNFPDNPFQFVALLVKPIFFEA
jgi:hypothetical protein